MEPSTSSQDNQTAENNPSDTPSRSTAVRLKTFLPTKHLIFCLVALMIGGFLSAVYLNAFYIMVAICIGILAFVFIYSSDPLKSFAQANNYGFLSYGFLPDQSGLIFDIGYGPEFSDIVYGLYRNWPFYLFVYSYSIDDQESSKRYARTVLSIDCMAPLPSFVLRKYRLLQIFEEEGESLRAHGYTQKIELEGDFDKYFQVFIKPDTQVEVLTILTPDFMELIMKLDQYEIEVTEDGKLYVYYHSTIKRKQDLTDTYAIIETLVPKIEAYVSRQQEIKVTS
jgi:hypothetical protein